MFAVLLGISGTVTVSKVQAETTSETSGETEETQESVDDTDSVLSDEEPTEEPQKSVGDMTTDELFEYLMSIDSETMDSLYDEYPNLNDLIDQLSDEQKEELAEKFGGGDSTAGQISTSTLIIDPNGGTYDGSSNKTYKTVDTNSYTEIKTIPQKEGYIFAGWKLSGSGTLYSGYKDFGTSDITAKRCTDSNGIAYTNYAFSLTNSTYLLSYEKPFYYFPYTAGHKYKMKFDIRVNQFSTSATESDAFRARILLKYSQDMFCDTCSEMIPKTTSGWQTYETADMTINDTSSTLFGTYTAKPSASLYIYTSDTANYNLNFDIKNIVVYDETTGTYVNATDSNGLSAGSEGAGTVYYSTGGTATLTAVWEQRNRYLTLNANGGTFSDGNTELQVGSLYKDSENWSDISSFTPTERTGYTFSGWYSLATNGIEIYNADGSAKNDTIYWSNNKYQLDKDLVVYARWLGNHYTNTLTYDANGGTGAPLPQTSICVYPKTQKNVMISATVPTKSGYTFTGWYTALSGGTEVTAGTFYTVGNENTANNQSATIYAHWEKQPQIAVECNITGSMGNKSTDFTYTLQLDKDTYANKAITTYDVETDTTSELTADENGLITFTLHNGEELQFTGLTADDLTDASTKVSATGLTDAGYTVTTSTTTSDDGKTATVTVTGTRNASVPTGNHISSNAENGLVVFGTLGLIAVAIELYRRKNHA